MWGKPFSRCVEIFISPAPCSMTTWHENFQSPFSNSWLCLHTQSYCYSCLGSFFLCRSLKSVSRNKTSKIQKLHLCFVDHLTVFLVLDVPASFIARAQWSRDKEGVRSYQSVQMTGFDCWQTSNSFFEVPQSMGHWDGSAGKGRSGDPHGGRGKLTLIYCPDYPTCALWHMSNPPPIHTMKHRKLSTSVNYWPMSGKSY